MEYQIWFNDDRQWETDDPDEARRVADELHSLSPSADVSVDRGRQHDWYVPY